ncbi:hypothetical protein M501DRAFT_1020865 [Patellaria atrata CBS 101060]|uniref:Uncharacterized protein n=1 Tax=Patellaria atrata CBS 101060 TaxID=1346257 RepID=A0A9P4VLQ7_9PEZI|nr:hypothetical protein M501DRAFT_1020865 [Patellaria atrata CBS 101060]
MFEFIVGYSTRRDLPVGMVVRSFSTFDFSGRYGRICAAARRIWVFLWWSSFQDFSTLFYQYDTHTHTHTHTHTPTSTQFSSEIPSLVGIIH